MSDEVQKHDGRKRRCPRLGHEVEFGYCRRPARELPCNKIFDCWWELFDVESFIRAHYSEEDIAKILSPPKPKVASIVELIEQAKKRNSEG
ncbi:MAG: hypothetical protein ACLFVW_02225 [Phycisphaerae bacterium]